MDLTPDYNGAPRNYNVNLPKYHEVIESCVESASSCWISADAFIGERDYATLSRAINACLSCAEVCAVTVKLLAASESATPQEIEENLLKCQQACLNCIEEITGHCNDHEHCLICVKSCQQFLKVCENYLK